MYWKYCVRRILNGIFILVIIVFIYSILFNQIMEQTVKWQIEEEIRLEMTSSMEQMSVEETQKYFEEQRQHKYRLYHLDKSAGHRIFFRALDTLTFRFGRASIIRSATGDESVWTIVTEVLPRTILLFTTAIAVDIVLALWLGVKKAQRAGSAMDKATSLGTMALRGLPSYWLGMIMIMVFAYGLRIFPSGGMSSSPPPQGLAGILDMLYHLALPVITLVILGFWSRSFLIRNILLGVLQEDYIMSARARGIRERRVLFGHAIRSAAPPIATMALLSLLVSVGGRIIFEGIFSWPGLGKLYFVSVEQNDIPVLMGCLFLTTGLYIFGLVLLDIVYGYLDPRIKVGGKG